MKPFLFFLLALLCVSSLTAQEPNQTINEDILQELIALGVDAAMAKPLAPITQNHGDFTADAAALSMDETLCRLQRAQFESWLSKLLRRQPFLAVEIANLANLISIFDSMGVPTDALRQQLDEAVAAMNRIQNQLNNERPERQEVVNEICYDLANVSDLDVAFYRHGRFTKGSNGSWQEIAGSKTYRFKQTHSDEWSVYLKATDRAEVYIQIDLWRRMIRYRAGNQAWQDLYAIEQVSSTFDFIH